MSSWSFRGTSLDTLGFVTLVWDSADVAERRGENPQIPFDNGRVWIAKYFEQRELTLGLEIVKNSIEELEDDVDALKKLIGQRTLGALQQTMESGSIRIGQAEYKGKLSPDRKSPTASAFTLDFVMPDPFFYSNVLTSVTEVIDSSPHIVSVSNLGTVEHWNPVITLNGPLKNTVLLNNGVSLTYNGELAPGDQVVIQRTDTKEYTAILNGTTNVIGNVDHNGAAPFFIIFLDDNDITVTDEIATTGSMKIEFYPRYL